MKSIDDHGRTSQRRNDDERPVEQGCDQHRADDAADDEDDPGHDAFIEAEQSCEAKENITATEKPSDANRERLEKNRKNGKDHSEDQSGDDGD